MVMPPFSMQVSLNAGLDMTATAVTTAVSKQQHEYLQELEVDARISDGDDDVDVDNSGKESTTDLATNDESFKHGDKNNLHHARSHLRVTPMMATVDRRQRQQQKSSCAVASFVALSHSAEWDLFAVQNKTLVLPYQDDDYQHVFEPPACSVCYQWANHIIAQEQIIQLVRAFQHNRNVTVYRPYDLGMEDTTVCVTGKATFAERQRWRSARWHYFRNRQYYRSNVNNENNNNKQTKINKMSVILPTVLFGHCGVICQNQHHQQYHTCNSNQQKSI
jgi:hypothetical protein